MLDKTFLKFLIAFILILSVSFLVMGIVGKYGNQSSVSDGGGHVFSAVGSN